MTKFGLAKYGSQYLSMIRDGIDELIRESNLSHNMKVSTLLTKIDKELEERYKKNANT